jgi:MFS-type transporter involved in bile tolerance (Atg22 family)
MTAFSLNIVLIISQLDERIRWRVIFAVNFIAICIVTVYILIGELPESPNSLIELKQEEKAR